MAQYIVSARRYRPKNFSAVVGQAQVTTTLQHALQRAQLAQAMLFCGPRGVGKTTCARILAKAINCTQRTETGDPCEQCTSCITFQDGRSLNIHELDAASNNSVEDIRHITEQVRYTPQAGRYNVYIIDEVHMLSNAAFNAFLKTLEEPPAHAIFILATTEKHKIIPTILSRCQIFDFKRILVPDIVQHLKQLAKTADVQYETEALYLIAQKADGALRDALSMFDLVLTFGAGKKLTYQAARDSLHVLDANFYLDLTDKFLQGDSNGVLMCYDEVLQRGFDGHHFVTGLGAHLRNLLICQHPRTTSLLAVTEATQQRYQTQVYSINAQWLIRALEKVNQCDLQYKNSSHQRLHVEILLLQLATHHDAISPDSSDTNCQTALTVTAREPQADKGTALSENPRAQKSTLANKQTPTDSSTNTVSATAGPTQVPSYSAKTSLMSSPSPDTAPVIQNPSETIDPSSITPTVSTSFVQLDAQAVLDTAMKIPQLPSLAALRRAANATSTTTAVMEEEPPAVEIQKNVHNLSQKQVSKACQAYAQQCKAAGQATAATVFTQTVTVQGHTITFRLTSSLQEDIFQAHKAACYAHLKEALQLKQLYVQAQRVETKEAAKPYTDAEKLAHMLKTYPPVAELCQRLELDPAY